MGLGKGEGDSFLCVQVKTKYFIDFLLVFAVNAAYAGAKNNNIVARIN